MLMSKIRTKHIAITLVAALTIATIVLLVAIPQTQSAAREKEERIVREQQIAIQDFLWEAPDRLFRGSALKEERDEDGRVYLVGELSEELDDWLDALVDGYNQDSSTTKHILIDTVRYRLTEGISEVANNPDSHQDLKAFIQWTGRSVPLVDEEGEEYEMDVLTNFVYYINIEYFNSKGIIAAYE